MRVWELNVEQNITSYWVGVNPSLVAEYKLEEPNSSWVTIGNMIDIGDSMFTVPHTFDSLGKFLIRVRDINTNVSIFDKLEVRNNENMEEFIKDTNYKVSNILKKWIKRGL